ncbi:MAG: hypothetical protein KF894_34460, partial [Labilithrix sp.]|nr:hypothetical protein [Labilithrix sp.]
MSRSRELRARLAPALVLLAASAVGCGQKDAPPRATSSAPDAAAGALAADAARDDAAGATSGDAPTSALAWSDAIRVGRFADAAAGIARLPADEQKKPEVRLARARVALALARPAEALAALETLDDELPLLRDLVVAMRARAELAVGPYDKAAEHFGGRSDVGSWILAAEAWDRVGDNTKARSAWDRVANAPKRSRAEEEKARLRRMQITRLKDGDPAAVTDARWLATNALDDAVFAEAAEVLEKQTPPKLLTADELMARARVLAEGGRTDEALRAVERAGTRLTAQGAHLPAIDLCHAKAEI